jgi:hypothetical protein
MKLTAASSGQDDPRTVPQLRIAYWLVIVRRAVMK